MNDFIKEYFTLNSSRSVDKGNGIAIFCAIVSIFACCYSLNLTSTRDDSLTQTKPVVREVEKKEAGKTVSVKANQSAARQASHKN